MGIDCGDRIEQIFREQYKTMFRVLRRIAANDFQVEDALQDAFALACDRRETVLAHPTPEAWMLVAAKNFLRNAKRADAKLARRLVLLDDELAAKLGTCDEVNIDLEYGGTIPEQEFNLLKRVYLEGYKQSEVAEEFHIAPNSAYMTVKRVREKMRARLEENEKKSGGTCYEFPGSEHYLSEGVQRDDN